MSKQNLRLSPAAIRRLQKQFGIKNLLLMGKEDMEKLDVDFFMAFTAEGLAHQTVPPSIEDLEETADIKGLINNVKDYLGNG